MQYNSNKKPYMLAAKAFRRTFGTTEKMDSGLYVEIVKQGGLERKEIHDQVDEKVRARR